MLYHLITSKYQRPNRLDKEKGEEYHRDWGRYIISHASNDLNHYRTINTLVNKAFYKGNQWILEEDLEAFLMDESGDVRNRIKFVHNLVRPMVEQFRGNAIRLDFNAKATSVSPQAINRRETELEQMLLFDDLANNQPVSESFREMVQDETGVGNNTKETVERFSRTYVDKFVKAINMLLQWAKSVNNMKDIAIELAEDAALGGLPVMKVMERNMEMIMEVVNPLYFFFDTSCKKPDLSDSEYMGEFWYTLPTEIFERWQDISDADREAIIEYTQRINYTDAIAGHLSNADGRVPVFEVYWRDTEEAEFGWVLDEWNYPMFTRINHEDSPFTDEDLMDEPPLESRHYTDGQVKVKRYHDILRYCHFIPAEILGTGEERNKKRANGEHWRDIVLEYGVYDNQEYDVLMHDSVHFPYKTFAWSYHEGEVLSPMDDAIDPQRFLNRMLSIAESQVNNSRGAGVIYDKDILDPQEGEEGLLRNMNMGKPVGVDAKRLGVQNVVGTYDMTVKQGTLGLFNIVNEIKQQIRDTTGVNEQMQGTTGGANLVGTTEMMIQRGTLMQEPFYYCIMRVMTQAFQSVATVGKRIYLKNKRKLAVIVGDEYAEVLEIADYLMNEDFRVVVKRANSEEQERTQVDQMLLQFSQAQLISPKYFAELYGKGTMDDLNIAVRNTFTDMLNEQQEAARAEERMTPMMAQMQEEQMQQQRVAQDAQNLKEGMVEKMKQQGDTKRTVIREGAKSMRDAGKDITNIEKEKMKIEAQKAAANKQAQAKK